MTKKKTASILETMLYDHKCNSVFINFDEDKEMKQVWMEKKEAFELAIQCLEREG